MLRDRPHHLWLVAALVTASALLGLPQARSAVQGARVRDDGVAVCAARYASASQCRHAAEDHHRTCWRMVAGRPGREAVTVDVDAYARCLAYTPHGLAEAWRAASGLSPRGPTPAAPWP